MKVSTGLTILFLFAFKFSGAQKNLPQLPNAEAPNAIEINDSIFGPVNVSRGYGYNPSGGRGYDLEFFQDTSVNEENSAWFKFTMEYDTTLIFDIVPVDSTDNYDFVLFKYTDPGFFQDLKNFKVQPERVCYSVNTSKNSSTGLSAYAANKITGVVQGPGYLAAIKAKAGETYYLMVNVREEYFKENKIPKGFRIYFYNYWPKKKPVILKNVLFETNKSVLLKSSFAELNKLLKMLQDNTKLKIEIRGHTDNQGDETKNQILSEERAKAVMEYLVSKGIEPRRILYIGYGSRNPIASNDTAEGRMKNRRVEFAIIMR
jgi:outer membrane protein OmpA-like peptidoglycan-associated protein